MAEKDTIIVVGVTREDGYGNLWVTPAGGGDEVKIGEKRSQLHPLFEQGKAVMLHWETYKNRPYVSDAKLVEGELPPPTKPAMLPEHEATDEGIKMQPPAPQAVGMITKEIGDLIRENTLIAIFGEEVSADLVGWYRGQVLGITRIPFDGKDLPNLNKGDKDVKATKELPVKETISGTRGVDDTGGGTQVTNAQELMAWAVKHGKEFGPSWVKKEALLGDDAISEKIAVEAYRTIKSKMNWED